jgi:hypothetical protein
VLATFGLTRYIFRRTIKPLSWVVRLYVDFLHKVCEVEGRTDDEKVGCIPGAGASGRFAAVGGKGELRHERRS